MSHTRVTNNMVVVFLVLGLAICTQAQNPWKKLSRSPFQPPVGTQFKKSGPPFQQPSDNVRNQRGGGGSIYQNPFTPPHNIMIPEVTTRRVEVTTPEPVPAVIETKTEGSSWQEEPPTFVGSPFTPPPDTEWRQNLPQRRPRPRTSSPWLNALEERQKENAADIPPISKIDISDHGRTNTKRIGERRRWRGRPKISTYQDNTHHRDIHDVGPGVTPWTRYTEKPRISDDVGNFIGRRTGRCGQVRYSPRNQICCEGKVARRRGISPACCGTEAYDTVFNKCCGGVVSSRTEGQPNCE